MDEEKPIVEQENNSPEEINQQEENIPEYPYSISLEQGGDLHLSVGDTYQLKIKTNPIKVKNSNGTWASSDESVATVDSDIIISVSSSALRYTTSSVITESTTLRYGVKINP